MMRVIVGALLLCLLWGPAATAMADPYVELDSLRWKQRVLLLPPIREASSAIDWAADAEAVLDRDLVLFRETNGEYRQWFPKPHAPTRLQLSTEMRDRAAGRVTLIGKDGTVKRRWKSESSKLPAIVFAVIDRMPMRQREMQRED